MLVVVLGLDRFVVWWVGFGVGWGSCFGFILGLGFDVVNLLIVLYRLVVGCLLVVLGFDLCVGWSWLNDFDGVGYICWV